MESLGTTETEPNDITFRINGDLQTIAASDSINGNILGVVIGVAIALAVIIVVTFSSIVVVIFALVKKKAGSRVDSSGTVHSSGGLSVGYGRLGNKSLHDNLVMHELFICIEVDFVYRKQLRGIL